MKVSVNVLRLLSLLLLQVLAMTEKTVVKEALKKAEDRLDCAICLQPYTDPRPLPCFLAFCKHCFERLIMQGEEGLTVPCPK